MWQEIVIIGNVGRDANFRYTPKGIAVCDFSVAVNKKIGKGPEAREITTWFSVTIWRDFAETIAKYITKGMLIMCAGTVTASVYIDKKTGEPVGKLELTADRIKLLSYPKDKTEQPPTHDVMASGAAPADEPEPEEQPAF